MMGLLERVPWRWSLEGSSGDVTLEGVPWTGDIGGDPWNRSS